MITLQSSKNARDAQDLLEPHLSFKDRIKTLHSPRYDVYGNKSFLVEHISSIATQRQDSTLVNANKLFRTGTVVLGFVATEDNANGVVCAQMLEDFVTDLHAKPFGKSLDRNASPSNKPITIEQAGIYLVLNLDLHEISELWLRGSTHDSDYDEPHLLAAMLQRAGFSFASNVAKKQTGRPLWPLELFESILHNGLWFKDRQVGFMVVSTVLERTEAYMSRFRRRPTVVDMLKKLPLIGSALGKASWQTGTIKDKTLLHSSKCTWPHLHSTCYMPKAVVANENSNEEPTVPFAMQISGPRRGKSTSLKLDYHDGVYTRQLTEQETEKVETLFPANLETFGKHTVGTEPAINGGLGIDVSRVAIRKECSHGEEQDAVKIVAANCVDLVGPGKTHHFLLTSKTLSVLPAKKDFDSKQAIEAYQMLSGLSGHPDSVKVAGEISCMFGKPAESPVLSSSPSVEVQYELMGGMPGVPFGHMQAFCRTLIPRPVDHGSTSREVLSEHYDAFESVLKTLFKDVVHVEPKFPENL